MKDQSVKFHGVYRKGEAVWSDSHGKVVRFLRMENGLAKVADEASLAELPGSFAADTLRRYSSSDRPALSEQQRNATVRDIVRSRQRG